MTDQQRIAEIRAECNEMKADGAKGYMIHTAQVDFLLSRLAAKDAEIELLREAQRWIPVSEKPRRTQNCLCLFNDGSMAIGWYNGVPYEFHPDITHWMPLPAAPDHVPAATKMIGEQP